jgi:hypothetical protein
MEWGDNLGNTMAVRSARVIPGSHAVGSGGVLGVEGKGVKGIYHNMMLEFSIMTWRMH